MANILRMTNTHKFALLSFFMAAMFKDKLKSRNSMKSKHLVKKFVRQQSCTWKHPFSWRSVQLNTYGKIYKACAAHPKENYSVSRKSKNIFLITKPLNPDCFWQKTIFFCFFILHCASWIIVAYIKVAWRCKLFRHFLSFFTMFRFVFYFSHFFLPLRLDYCKV